jgi:hypothetical protein
MVWPAWAPIYFWVNKWIFTLRSAISPEFFIPNWSRSALLNFQNSVPWTLTEFKGGMCYKLSNYNMPTHVGKISWVGFSEDTAFSFYSLQCMCDLLYPWIFCFTSISHQQKSQHYNVKQFCQDCQRENIAF